MGKTFILLLVPVILVLFAQYALTIPVDSSTALSSDDEPVVNKRVSDVFPLAELPARVLHHLSTHLSSEDTRSLVSTSRLFQDAIASLNTDKVKFRGTSDLASVQLCLETCNSSCLEYWAPLLSETFSQEQLLSIRVLGEITSQKCVGSLGVQASFLSRINTLLEVEGQIAFSLILTQMIMSEAMKLNRYLKPSMSQRQLSPINSDELSALRLKFLSAAIDYAKAVEDMIKNTQALLNMRSAVDYVLEQKLWSLLIETDYKPFALQYLMEADVETIRTSSDSIAVQNSCRVLLLYWNACLAAQKTTLIDHMIELMSYMQDRPFRSVYDSTPMPNPLQVDSHDPFFLAKSLSWYVHEDVSLHFWDYLIRSHSLNELRYYLCDLGIFRRGRDSQLYQRIWLSLSQHRRYAQSVSHQDELELVTLVHENMENYPQLLVDAKAFGNAAIISYLEAK